MAIYSIHMPKISLLHRKIILFTQYQTNFPGGSDGKAFDYSAEDPGSIPGTISWRRKWQPTLVFLPGKSHGRKGLVDYNPWGCKQLDRTEWLHFHFSPEKHGLGVFFHLCKLNRYQTLPHCLSILLVITTMQLQIGISDYKDYMEINLQPKLVRTTISSTTKYANWSKLWGH